MLVPLSLISHTKFHSLHLRLPLLTQLPHGLTLPGLALLSFRHLLLHLVLALLQLRQLG